MCNRSLKQTTISLSSCEAEFCAASGCAGELLGLAELFKELHNNVSVRLEMDSDSARHIPQRRGPGGLEHIGVIQQWIREKRLSVSRRTRRTTLQISLRNIWMDCERSRSQGNLDYESWMVRMLQMETTEEQ